MVLCVIVFPTLGKPTFSNGFEWFRLRAALLLFCHPLGEQLFPNSFPRFPGNHSAPLLFSATRPGNAGKPMFPNGFKFPRFSGNHSAPLLSSATRSGNAGKLHLVSK